MVMTADGIEVQDFQSMISEEVLAPVSEIHEEACGPGRF